MKTPRETAIEILEWLNFDSARRQDWIEGIAEIIAINHDVHTFNNLTVAGMTIPEILRMKAENDALKAKISPWSWGAPQDFAPPICTIHLCSMMLSFYACPGSPMVAGWYCPKCAEERATSTKDL